DLLGAHDEVELQEIQIESGGQDADVARDLVTAGEDDGRLGEMVDLASPEHDLVVAPLLLQADRDGNALLPGIVAGADVRAERLLADHWDPVALEEPPSEPGKPPEPDEDQIIFALNPSAKQYHRRRRYADRVEALTEQRPKSGAVRDLVDVRRRAL